MSNMHNALCSCAECQISKSQAGPPPAPPPAGEELVPRVTMHGTQLYTVSAVVPSYSVDGVHYFTDARLAIAAQSRTPREIRLIEATMYAERLEGPDRIKLVTELARSLADEMTTAGEGDANRTLAILAHLAKVMHYVVGD